MCAVRNAQCVLQPAQLLLIATAIHIHMKLQDLFLVKMDPPTPIPNGQWRTPWRTPSIFPLPATATGAGFDSRTRPTPGPKKKNRLERVHTPTAHLFRKCSNGAFFTSNYVWNLVFCTWYLPISNLFEGFLYTYRSKKSNAGDVNLEMRREEIRIRHFPRKFRSKSVAHGSAQFQHDGLQPEGSLRRSADVASRVPG